MNPGLIGERQRIQYAGFWRRAAAIVLDCSVLGCVAWATAEFVALFAPAEGLGGLRDFLQVMEVVLTWLYFSGCESSRFQATPGKLVLGVKVTNMQGERISFARATARHFGKIVSALPLGIGFVGAASPHGKRQALHDAIASTVVIVQWNARAIPPRKD